MFYSFVCQILVATVAEILVDLFHDFKKEKRLFAKLNKNTFSFCLLKCQFHRLFSYISPVFIGISTLG